MKRFCIMLAAAMLAGLLAACGTAPQSAAPAESTSLPAAVTGQPLRRLESGDADAYYQVQDAGDGTHTILYRIDLVTGACAPVCDVSGCNHTADSCPALHPVEAGWTVQVLDESTLLSGNMTSLYRCDRDGRNLTLVIDDSRFSFTDYLFTDGESVYTVGNPSCKESNGVLYRISLDSGKAEPVVRLPGIYLILGVSGRWVVLDQDVETDKACYDIAYNLDTSETRTLSARPYSGEVFSHNSGMSRAVLGGMYYAFDFSTRTVTGKDAATGETVLQSSPFPADPNEGRGYESCRPMRVLDGWLELDYSSNDWEQEDYNQINFSYLVSLETGEVRRKPDLPMQTWNGYPHSPAVVLDLGDRLLVTSRTEPHIETHFDNAGAPYTVESSRRILATIQVEDYLSGTPNYTETEGWI